MKPDTEMTIARRDIKVAQQSSQESVPEVTTEKKPFSAKEHERKLCLTITEMVNGDEIKSFFGQFHADDLPKLQQILSKESNNPKYGKIADLLRGNIVEETTDVKGITAHKLQDIQQQFRDFCESFYITIDNKLSARAILGLEESAEVNETLIKTRTAQMHGAQKEKGSGQPQNFVRHLIGRANQQLRQEQEKIRQEKEKTPSESWLNIKKEQAYASLIASLEKMNHKEQITWLGLILETDFTEAEAEKIQLRFLESPDASQIANYPIKRPVIECADLETVILLAQKSGHRQPEKIGGFTLTGGRLSRKGLEEVAIIVASNNPETTKHEIRHSIEPKTRAGFDRALSEIFAYAERYAKTGEWQKLEAAVVDELYFADYKTGLDDVAPQTREKLGADEKSSFKKLVHDAVEQLKKRIVKIGELDAIREILTTGSLVEYTDEKFRKMKAKAAKIKIK